MAAIEALADEPRPSGVKKPVGSQHIYRIRVGDYRVVYGIDDGVFLLLVQRVRQRGEVYR
jgi:mRNA interferase RelE/StbE